MRLGRTKRVRALPREASQYFSRLWPLIFSSFAHFIIFAFFHSCRRWLSTSHAATASCAWNATLRTGAGQRATRALCAMPRASCLRTGKLRYRGISSEQVRCTIEAKERYQAFCPSDTSAHPPSLQPRDALKLASGC